LGCCSRCSTAYIDCCIENCTKSNHNESKDTPYNTGVFVDKGKVSHVRIMTSLLCHSYLVYFYMDVVSLIPKGVPMTADERKRDEKELALEIVTMLTKDQDPDMQKILAHLTLNFLAILIEEVDAHILMPQPYVSSNPHVTNMVLVQWLEAVRMVDGMCKNDKRKGKRILAYVCGEICTLVITPLCIPLDLSLFNQAAEESLVEYLVGELTKELVQEKEKVLAHLALNLLAALTEEVGSSVTKQQPFPSSEPVVQDAVKTRWTAFRSLIDTEREVDRRKHIRVIALVCKQICTMVITPLCKPLPENS